MRIASNAFYPFNQMIMKDLIGTTVMVQPDMLQDPMEMQGYTGKITRIFDDYRAACVKFEKSEIGFYPTDLLLMLIPADIVVDRLRNPDKMDLQIPDAIDVFEMYQLHATGLPEAQKMALDWAVSHDKLSEAIVCSVRDLAEGRVNRFGAQQRSGRRF